MGVIKSFNYLSITFINKHGNSLHNTISPTWAEKTRKLLDTNIYSHRILDCISGGYNFNVCWSIHIDMELFFASTSNRQIILLGFTIFMTGCTCSLFVITLIFVKNSKLKVTNQLQLSGYTNDSILRYLDLEDNSSNLYFDKAIHSRNKSNLVTELT